MALAASIAALARQTNVWDRRGMEDKAKAAAKDAEGSLCKSWTAGCILATVSAATSMSVDKKLPATLGSVLKCTVRTHLRDFSGSGLAEIREDSPQPRPTLDLTDGLYLPSSTSGRRAR
jgi:hypothetical protein